MNTVAIESLETSAGTAGDLLQAAICQIALNGEPNESTLDALSPAERTDLHLRFADFNGDESSEWRKLAAEQECLRVIADHA